MPQVFSSKMNILAKAFLLGGVLSLVLLSWGGLAYTRSSYGTGIGLSRVQPVPFSHEHHAGDLHVDCRYCHTLKPVRESYRSNEPLRWQRVYNLPGFVYFDHSIHVQKGVGCSTCHGRIDEMPFTYQAPSLLMEWCLECHRNPERQVRPREEVFNMNYRQPGDQLALGRKLVKEYEIKDPVRLTSCSICHR
jgi:hypothetical protein